MSYVVADDVSFAYPTRPGSQPVPALSNLAATVQPGSFTVVLGPNGSGKSTFARMCNVLLVPSAGKVVVDGLDTGLPEHLWSIRDRVGMVFQNPDNQIVAAVVEEDIAFGPENQALPPSVVRQRVEEAMAAVGLSAWRLRPPHLLSGGQKQRLAVAGALALRPSCLVLDEPTAMLDPVGRIEVMETVSRLNRDVGITIIWITHYMEEAVNADRVLVMSEGRAVVSGTPAEVFARADLIQSVNLDLPPALIIAERLRVSIPSVSAGLLTLDSLAAELDREWRTKGARAAAAGLPVPCPPQSPAPGLRTSPDRREISPCLVAEGLGYTYNPGTPHQWQAISDISVSIGDGEFWGIIGSTGSGKSTLVQHFNGLLRPSAGSLRVFGTEVSRPGASLTRLRQQVGLVFQYPEHQLFAATVYDEVAFGPRNLGLSAAEVDLRVNWALAAVGLSEILRTRSPFALSGGQARRLALAGVLAMHPKILVLDEPAAGLDPGGRKAMLALIQELHRSGLTIILVSHNMDDVAELAQKLLILHQGKAVMQGAKDQLFRQAAVLRTLGLGVPAGVRLLELLRERGWPLPGRAVTTSEALNEIVRVFDHPAGRRPGV